MANTILTPSWIVKEALTILHEKLSFIGTINRQYDSAYEVAGAKVGDTISYRLPAKFTVRSGATLSVQDYEERKVDVVTAQQKGVDIQFSSKELTLDIDSFRERILEPAMAQLAASIEADVLSNVYKDVYNLVGTPGQVPSSLAVFLNARRKLNEYLAPKDNNRSVLVNSETMVSVVDALKGLFQDSEAIAQQYREGFIGRTAGFNWYESEMVPVHVNGSASGTPLVKGAGQTGSSLVTDGWTANTTLKKGTVFTIDGVYAVHPETKQSYPFLQQFVVTADVTADGTGNATVPISPAIETSGPYQNVSNAPADNAAITVVGSANGSYAQNLAYHRDAFIFATARLVMPDGVDFKAQEELDGISMRIVRQYDINTDNFPCRIDVLYGYKCVRPELAVRVTA